MVVVVPDGLTVVVVVEGLVVVVVVVVVVEPAGLTVVVVVVVVVVVEPVGLVVVDVVLYHVPVVLCELLEVIVSIIGHDVSMDSNNVTASIRDNTLNVEAVFIFLLLIS